MPNSKHIPPEFVSQFVNLMNRSRKIAILAVFCMLFSQLSAAFATAAPLTDVEQPEVAAHQHGHEAMHAEHHGEDCLDPVTTTDRHQSMDCDDNCMDCVNHCSSVGILSEQNSDKILSHRTASSSHRGASCRIENPFRPPIAS